MIKLVSPNKCLVIKLKILNSFISSNGEKIVDTTPTFVGATFSGRVREKAWNLSKVFCK